MLLTWLPDPKFHAKEENKYLHEQSSPDYFGHKKSPSSLEMFCTNIPDIMLFTMTLHEKNEWKNRQIYEETKQQASNMANWRK